MPRSHLLGHTCRGMASRIAISALGCPWQTHHLPSPPPQAMQDPSRSFTPFLSQPPHASLHRLSILCSWVLRLGPSFRGPRYPVYFVLLRSTAEIRASCWCRVVRMMATLNVATAAAGCLTTDLAAFATHLDRLYTVQGILCSFYLATMPSLPCQLDQVASFIYTISRVERRDYLRKLSP